jgi:YD repeat-containing protein
VADIAIDSADRIFISAEDGTIRIYDADGRLLDPAFASGLGIHVTLAFSTSGAFGTHLYVLHSGGDLLRFDALGHGTVIGSGFEPYGNIAFGPDGALYVPDFWNDRILRIIGPLATIDSPTRSGDILAGDTLRFRGESTAVQQSSPLRYSWSFGDGRTSTLQNPSLVGFPTAGTFEVSLDAYDNQGHHSEIPDTRTITVVPDTNSIPDLAVTQLNVPANLAIGEPAQITYAVRNAGDEDLSGQSWKDALYLSRDPYLDVNDQLLVSAAVSNTVAVGSSYTNTLTVTLPVVEEGAYYLLLSVDDEWQVLERHQLNNEFAVATDLVIPRLTNAVPFAGSLSGNGDEKYFRIDVPAGQNLLIRLDDADNQGANEVYVRFGALPMRGAFDFRATTPGSADQQLLIPAAAPGTYYIMVHGESVPGDGQFTLEATAAQLEVTGVTPSRYGQSAVAVLTVTGAGFDATAVVELVASDGTAYRATSVSADSFTQLTATFDLSSVPEGMYSLRVSSPLWGTSALANAFEVLPAGEARLETNLIVPSRLGYHAVATIYVEYRNTGNAAMPVPLLVLTATQNGHERAFLTLQPTRLVEGFWTSAVPEGFSHSVQLLASGDTPGVLQPGESVRVPVYYAGWQQPWDTSSYPPINWNLGVLPADDTTAVDWAALKTSMQPATINAEAWEVIWAAFTSQVGTTWGDYVGMLDDNAAYLGRLGQRVVDVGQLLAFEFLQADGLSPLRTLASAVDAAVEAPGLPLVFSRSFPESISQRFELGPLGRGWSHNWQYSLSVADDGTVTITGPGGSRRIFQPDSRYNGRYFAQSGDHATLTPLGGGVFSLREPAGLLRVFRTDRRLDYVEDPNGNRITCGYSGGLLTSLTHTSGQYLQLTYNGAGRINDITDHLGRQTAFSYDGSGEHLLTTQYYDGRTATYTYAGAPASSRHAVTEVANSCCTSRHFTYDVQGRLWTTYLDGNAELVTFTYDTAGKVTATDAIPDSSHFYFDHRGLLVKAEDALGNAVHLAFDDHYNLVRLTDPAGRSYGHAYDGNGNLTQSSDPLGHASRITLRSTASPPSLTPKATSCATPTPAPATCSPSRTPTAAAKAGPTTRWATRQRGRIAAVTRSATPTTPTANLPRRHLPTARAPIIPTTHAATSPTPRPSTLGSRPSTPRR